jgi:hypothetical protein
MSKDEAFEAALLAKFVGSNLNQIDSMTTERHANRANRINMQQFVAPLVSNQTSQSYNNSQPPIPNGFAPPIPEELIRQMVPEPPRTSPPVQETSNNTQINNVSNIEEILKSIDKKLDLLVGFIKNG